MPFPSGACQTCKLRRIKCDETKPTCRRCEKSRRVCLETSAAKQASFSIHVENCYASGETKRPRGPRSSLTLRHPRFDLQSRALDYYLQCHLQILTDVPKASRGLSQCVSVWKASGRTCLMVDLALSSMALAVYSRTQQHPLAAIEASSRYQRLLLIMQKRIKRMEILRLNKGDMEACLLAIFLMSRYEGATHTPGSINSNDSFKSLQSWCHHNGAMAILKIWNDNLIHNTATYIIKQTRRGLIRSSLLRNRPLPDWIQDGKRFGEHDLDLEYDRIIVRTVNLHYATASLPQKNDFLILKAEELYNEARGLDKALQDWATQNSSTCSYQRHILTEPDPLPRCHFYSPIVYSYSSAEYAGVWSQYLATRMLINSIRLRILELCRLKPLFSFTCEKQRLECIAQLGAAADGLASTIPFCLERFKADDPDSSIHQNSVTISTNEKIKPHLASLVVWPLTIASSLRGVDDRQQLWFRSELARLGRITGSGILECAETRQWAVL